MRWQVWVIVLTIAGTILAADMAAQVFLPIHGSAGWRLALGRVPGTLAIASVDPAGPAARAGIEPGDAIDVASLTWYDRAVAFNPYVGAKLVLSIVRAGERRDVPLTLVADRQSVFSTIEQAGSSRTLELSGLLVIAGNLWMLAFAYVVGRRRPGDRDVRAICGILFAYAIGDGFLNFTSNVPALNVGAIVFATGGVVLSTTLFALFALHFVPPSPLRTAAGVTAIVLWTIAVLQSLLVVEGIVTGRPDPFALAGSVWTGIFSGNFHFLVPRGFALACGIWAVLASSGTNRQRIAWATGSTGVLFGATLISQPLVILGIAGTAFANLLVNLGVFLLPVGLTYSVLSRRLLDIEFVFNRAAVFSAVSLLLVGTFVLVEWLLGGWLQGASHTTNVVVSAGLAIALGFSTRFVHARVDHVVDNVFFKKRHDDERAIRTFAQEAPYITDAPQLVERTITVLQRHTEASFVDVVLADGRGRYGDVSENDPAIVRLRATNQVVDLHAVDTGLRGDSAYPMVARGRLVGVLAVGPRTTGETYAPDETAAVANLALSVGAALDVLSAGSDDSIAELRRTIESLERTIAGLSQTIIRRAAD